MVTVPQLVLLAVGFILLGIQGKRDFDDTTWYGYIGMVSLILGIVWNFAARLVQWIIKKVS